MESPDDTSLDAIVAAGHFEDYGNFRYLLIRIFCVPIQTDLLMLCSLFVPKSSDCARLFCSLPSPETSTSHQVGARIHPPWKPSGRAKPIFSNSCFTDTDTLKPHWISMRSIMRSIMPSDPQHSRRSFPLHPCFDGNTDVLQRRAAPKALNPLSVDEMEDDIITPPPLDDTTEEDRDTENRARKALEDEGCPPCYPPEIVYPCRDPPEQYREVMLYWAISEAGASLPTPVLYAQLSDWKRFRAEQAANRHAYRRRPFHEYEAAVRQLREKYGIYGEVHLRPDPILQSQRENWVEFQYYHFRWHDILLKEFTDLSTSLEGKPQDKIDFFQPKLGFYKRQCERHENLLHWIEQVRVKMEAHVLSSVSGREQCQTHVSDNDDLNQVQRPPTPDHGRKKRQTKNRAVLGEASVSKTKHKRRSTRSKPEAFITATSASPPPPLPEMEQSAFSPQSCRASRTTATPRRGRSRQAKEEALRQLRPHKVVKGKARKSPSSAIQTHLRRHSPLQHSPPATKFRTKSGRVSRMPVRWTPSAQSPAN